MSSTRNPLSDAQVKSPEQIFQEFDQDNSGTIDQQELIKALNEATDTQVTEEQVQKLMTIIDTDGDGNVSYEEFVTFISGAQTLTMSEIVQKMTSEFTMGLRGASDPISAAMSQRRYVNDLKKIKRASTTRRDDAFSQQLSTTEAGRAERAGRAGRSNQINMEIMQLQREATEASLVNVEHLVKIQLITVFNLFSGVCMLVGYIWGMVVFGNNVDSLGAIPECSLATTWIGVFSIGKPAGVFLSLCWGVNISRQYGEIGNPNGWERKVGKYFGLVMVLFQFAWAVFGLFIFLAPMPEQCGNGEAAGEAVWSFGMTWDLIYLICFCIYALNTWFLWHINRPLLNIIKKIVALMNEQANL